MNARLASLALLAAALAGCSLFRGAPEEPTRAADRLRKAPVPYAQLEAAAARGPARNVLWLRETYLAELSLGATTEQVRRRWGEPTRVVRAPEGTWWEFEEVYPKPGATSPEPTPSNASMDERREPVAARVGMNLRLLFVEPASNPASPSPIPTASPVEGAVAATPKPVLPVLAHIQAWAPARFQTRTLVRVLDPAARVERKYGKAPQVLPWGAGEVWIYPAANVAFVVTADHEDQPRVVAGTLVGF